MSDLDLSIIIVNYNTFDLTCDCIRSVMQHTLGASYEIIVVDNHSKDRSPRQFLDYFPDVVLIENKKNEGFAKANNAGLRIAKGRYILLLNSDAYLMENTCQIVVTYMDSQPKIGALSPRIVYPNGTIQHVAQRFPKVSVLLFEMFRLQKIVSSKIGGRFLLGSFFDHSETLEVDWVWGTCLFLRSELILRMPGERLDDSYFMYSEDMQWCLDVGRMGYKVVYYPQTTIAHLKSGSSQGVSEWERKSLQLFMEKNYGKIHRTTITALQQLLRWSVRKS